MSWLDSLINLFRRQPDMIRLITDKFKELHDITDKENKELKKRIAKLEMEVSHNKKEIEELQDHEKDCHRMLIKANEDNKNLREWIIFELKMKPPKI